MVTQGKYLTWGSVDNSRPDRADRRPGRVDPASTAPQRAGSRPGTEDGAGPRRARLDPASSVDPSTDWPTGSPSATRFSPGLIDGGSDQCEHGVARGRWLRPGSGTPGCPLCRHRFATEHRDQP